MKDHFRSTLRDNFLLAQLRCIIQKWEQGHNPELHVGTDVTDLNGMDENRMQQLLRQKGFSLNDEL